MELVVNEHITLQTLVPDHGEELYALIVHSKEHLQRWLPWVKNVESVEYIEQFINDSILRSDNREEYAFVILYHGKIAGRIGLYHIHGHNKIAEIGYWLGAEYLRKGIVGECCKAIIQYGFEVVEMNRLEIKCAVENKDSIRIPIKLGFKHEGILRQAEWLDEGFVNLNLYSLLQSEWEPQKSSS